MAQQIITHKPLPETVPELVSLPGFTYTFSPSADDVIPRRRAQQVFETSAQDGTRMNTSNTLSTPEQTAIASHPERSANSSFQHQATASIQAVRRSLSNMFDASSMPVFKSRDVLKYFGVDINLSWQIFKLLGPGDLLGLAKYIPPAVSMQRLFAGCRTKRIAEPLIVAAEQAFEQFELFVATHAGERGRFESMAASMAEGEEAAQADLLQRKALFRAHAHFWGVEVGISYLVNVIGLSPTNPELCDSVALTHLIDFRRLRPNADTFVVAMQQRKIDTDKAFSRVPLSEEGFAQHHVPVIPQFSTNALPLMKTEVNEWGLARTRLIGETVGLSSSVDFAFGEINRHVSSATLDGGGGIVCQSVTTRPTQRLYLEVLAHRKAFARLQSEVNVYGHFNTAAPPSTQEKPEWRLPCRERVEHLTPDDDTRLADVPRRREIIQYIMARQGWSIEDFEVYRLHIEYPMLDTLVQICLANQK